MILTFPCLKLVFYININIIFSLLIYLFTSNLYIYWSVLIKSTGDIFYRVMLLFFNFDIWRSILGDRILYPRVNSGKLLVSKKYYKYDSLLFWLSVKFSIYLEHITVKMFILNMKSNLIKDQFSVEGGH